MTNSFVEVLAPKLLIIRGLPGSGKSYLAVELQKRIGAENVVILDPDTTDYDSEEYTQFSQDLLTQEVDKKLHPYRFLRSKAYEAITSGKIIIWNQAFTNLDLLHRTILNLQNYALDNNTQLSTLIVEVEIDLQTAKERVKLREKQGGHGVSDNAFERFVNDFETFAEYGYPTVSVHGHEPISDSVTRVLNEIKEL